MAIVNIFIENVTAHRKTYFNAYPLNGQNRKSSVSCPLQIFFKTVNLTVVVVLERKVYPLAKVLFPLAVGIRTLEH